MSMFLINSKVARGRWEYKTSERGSLVESISLTVKCISWMYMKGIIDPMNQCELQSLEWMVTWRILGPTYLFERRSTQSFGKDWIKFETSFLKGQIFVLFCYKNDFFAVCENRTHDHMVKSQGSTLVTLVNHNVTSVLLLSLSQYFFVSLYTCDIVVGQCHQCHQPQCHSSIILKAMRSTSWAKTAWYFILLKWYYKKRQ